MSENDKKQLIQELNSEIALACQSYNEIVSIISPEKWAEKRKLLSKEQLTVVMAKARDLSEGIEKIEELLKESDGWKQVARSAQKFFIEIYPKQKEIKSLWRLIWSDIWFGKPPEGGSVRPVDNDVDNDDQFPTIYSVFDWGAYKARTTLETMLGFWEEDWPEKFYAVKNAEVLLRAEFFAPDEWWKNWTELPPWINDANSKAIGFEDRADEIRLSLIIGNNMSAIALCRVIFEGILAKCCEKQGIKTKYPNGKSKGLDKLIDDYTDKVPCPGDVHMKMNTIKEEGNKVVHPSKGGENTEEKWRKRALKTWCALRDVLTFLYK